MKNLEHPLEKLFDIEAGSTIDIEKEYDMIEQPVSTELSTVEKDEEDTEIDKKIDDVYSAAIDEFNNMTQYIESIEPRYAARTSEVAATYLNIALNAANSRARVKTDRKRSNQFIPYNSNNKTTNNLIVADRNEILKMLQVDNEKKVLGE